MAYPSYATVPWGNPAKVGIRYKTIKSDFGEAGLIQRKKKFLFPRRDITLVYPWLTVADAATLWEHFKSMSGSYGEFAWFDVVTAVYAGEYVGTGDGTQLIWNMPCKLGSDIKIYIDGIEQTLTTDYAIDLEDGADGEDKVTFVTEPAAGQRITCDFDGYLKVRCAYKEDIADFEQFYARLVNHGIELEGLLNA
jgi:hypothetical protein